MTRIMTATVRHVTSSSGLRKFQAAWFLLNRGYLFLNKNDLNLLIWSSVHPAPDSTQKWITIWMSVCRHSNAVSKLIDPEHFIVCFSTGFTFLFAGLWLSAAVSFDCSGLVYDVGRASNMQVSMSGLHCTILYLVNMFIRKKTGRTQT